MASRRRQKAVIESSSEEDEGMEVDQEPEEDPDRPGPSTRWTKKRPEPAKKPPSRTQPSSNGAGRRPREARPAARSQPVVAARDSSDEEAPDAQSGNSDVRLVHSLAHYILTVGGRKGAIAHVDISKLIGKEAAPAKEAKVKNVENLLVDAFGLKLVRDKKEAARDRYFLGDNLVWDKDTKDRVTKLLKGVPLANQNGEAHPRNQENDDGEAEDADEDRDAAANAVANTDDEDEDVENNKDLLEQAEADGVLIVVLMCIFMVKRHTSEDEPGVPESLLTELMEKVCPNDKDRLVKLLSASPPSRLVSQGWLSVTKATDNDEALYDWGPRAKLFVDRQQLLEAFCEIYGQPSAMWPDQLAAIERDA